MALTLKQTVIVSNWLNKRVDEIKASVNKNFKATGKTRDSITSRIEGDSAIIEGSSILFFGEFGRGVTSEGKRGRLSSIIREWIDVKGIQPKDSKISKNTLAFLIARKIDREGIRVPNKYNEGGILSSVINEKAIEELIAEFGATLVGEFESELLEVLNIE